MPKIPERDYEGCHCYATSDLFCKVDLLPLQKSDLISLFYWVRFPSMLNKK